MMMMLIMKVYEYTHIGQNCLIRNIDNKIYEYERLKYISCTVH